MRVPVYQQQVTPQIPSGRSQVSVPEGAAGVAVRPIDTTAGIAQGVESLRLGLVKMQENRDKFMLASAVNEYRRSNTEFLHAKDTGVFAKKGKDVFGISQQYDEFSSKTMEDIAKRYKMSGAARDRFVEATSALYNASLSSVMTHEQRETDAAQQQEWKAMASDTLSNIALCYADDNAFNENVQFGLSAISQQWEPYGDQVRDSKMREYLSQCQVQRVAAMLEESPKAAGAYLEKHKGDFAGDDYLKVKKAVDNKLDVIRVQETTDMLVQRFRDKRSMLAYIHKNFEGKEENDLITAAKARWSEKELSIAEMQAAHNRGLRANFSALYRNYWSQGKTAPVETIEKMYAQGQLSDSGYKSALDNNALLSSRRGAEAHVERTRPDASPEVKEAEVQKLLGLKEEDIKAADAAIYSMLLDGSLTEEILTNSYNAGLITKTKRRTYLSIMKDLPQAQKRAASAGMKSIEQELKKSRFPSQFVQSWKASVNERAADELDGKDANYADKHQKIALEEAIKKASEGDDKVTLERMWGLPSMLGLDSIMETRSDQGIAVDKFKAEAKGITLGGTSRKILNGMLQSRQGKSATPPKNAETARNALSEGARRTLEAKAAADAQNRQPSTDVKKK